MQGDLLPWWGCRCRPPRPGTPCWPDTAYSRWRWARSTGCTGCRTAYTRTPRCRRSSRGSTPSRTSPAAWGSGSRYRRRCRARYTCGTGGYTAYTPGDEKRGVRGRDNGAVQGPSQAGGPGGQDPPPPPFGGPPNFIKREKTLRVCAHECNAF